jgi:hypothetical protein
MNGKTTAQVRVLKAGRGGRPVAEVFVSSAIGAAQLGAVVQKVASNGAVLSAAGLKACLGCKSGLDINILDHQEVVQVEV